MKIIEFYCKNCNLTINSKEKWNVKCSKCGNIIRPKGSIGILLKGLPTVKK
jgi:ribosomal protein S27E